MPAKNDREKYRIAGITKHSRNAWTIRQTRLVHPFHRPRSSFVGLPEVLLDGVHAETARGVRTLSAHPTSLFQREFPIVGIFFRILEFYCATVCPCQGSTA
jgi:hypothetical protein